MSYLRVSSGATAVVLADLGYTVPAATSNYNISDQFSVEDLQNSKDLVTAVQLTAALGGLDAKVNLDGTWTAVLGADFDPEDVYAASANIYEIVNTVDNQRLVDGSDCSVSTQLHMHDNRYYTKGELGSTTPGSSGANLIGTDPLSWTLLSGTTVQQVFDNLDTALSTTLVTLDTAYTNDTDGIMNVNGSSKPLDLRSNNVNDVIIGRQQNVGYGMDIQDILRADVSASELLLGHVAVNSLPQVDVRVRTDLYVDGNITFVGTITDTTVSELNVTDVNILLRTGATVGGDASLQVERGVTGANADLRWDELSQRWMAGVVGNDHTIALLELNEVVTGVWDFQGGAATDPNLYLTQKAVAPTTQLGASNQIPFSVINGQLATYDKTNSRNKFLSVSRQYVTFGGRDNAKISNEYLRNALFTSNESSTRLIQDATLVGISITTAVASTWNVRVRKNGVATNLYTKSQTGSTGTQDNTLNLNFDAGDIIQVYGDGSNIDRPLVVLEFAYRY